MAEVDKVKELLKETNLSQYFDKFLEVGYDDLNHMISMANSAVELESMMKDVGMFDKSGHRKRFAAAVQILASKNEHGEPTKSSAQPMNQADRTTHRDDDVSKCKYLVLTFNIQLNILCKSMKCMYVCVRACVLACVRVCITPQYLIH